MSYYGYDNSYILEAVRRQPDIFRGVAVIDWNSSDPEAKMLRLAQQGVRGFRIFPQNLPAETNVNELCKVTFEPNSVTLSGHEGTEH